MVMSSQRQPPATDALLQFLQRRLGLSPSALELGQRQTPLKELQQGVRCWGLPLAGHHHGRDQRLAQFGKARQSCMGPSLMALSLIHI